MKEILLKEAGEFAEFNRGGRIINPFTVGSFYGKFIETEGCRRIDLTRLDYLALGSTPEIKRILHGAVESTDLGCPASQKVLKTSLNVDLEKSLANLHGMNQTLVFTSGYAANDNFMEALAARTKIPYLSIFRLCKNTSNLPTIFFVDGESHFSLQHGIRRSRSVFGSKAFTFPSGNYEKLELLIKKAPKESVRVIISDTLSSATGVVFNTECLCEIAAKYDCLLYLDEAHAIGALGKNGAGIASGNSSYNKYKNHVMIMGTLTKALCSMGGYVSLSDENLADFFQFCCPQYIFSAPIPPWMAKSLSGIVALVSGDWGDKRRETLAHLSAYLRKGLIDADFDTMNSSSHIVPVFVGDDEKATRMYRFLQGKGFEVSCFRYPAVAESSALIRISVCSDLEFCELDELVHNLKIARNI